jgi:peptidoglycan/xylan/chitin deacetylase (PgdA/CDA1 family)
VVKYLLLTFDIEDLNVVPRTHSNEKHLFKIGQRGTEIILDLLKRKRAKATFFVTNEFAQHAPSTVQRIVKEGHELASHGYLHEHNYKTMSEQKALQYLTKSKKELENKFKTTVRGFRSARLEHPAYRIIKEAGFSYDSSLHPTWVPGKYNDILKPRNPFVRSGLTVIPVSVGVFVPFSWFWFRNFGLLYAKTCSLLALLYSRYINIYFHPWEFVDLTKIPERNQIWSLIKRRTGKKVTTDLERYIDWCLKKGLKPETLSGFLKKEHGR